MTRTTKVSGTGNEHGSGGASGGVCEIRGWIAENDHCRAAARRICREQVVPRTSSVLLRRGQVAPAPAYRAGSVSAASRGSNRGSKGPRRKISSKKAAAKGAAKGGKE